VFFGTNITWFFNKKNFLTLFLLNESKSQGYVVVAKVIALFDKALVVALAVGLWQCVQCGWGFFLLFLRGGKKKTK